MGMAPWEVVRAGRPAPGFVQGPERSPETVWKRKPSLVTSVGLVSPQACVFTVLESSATNQTLIQKVRLTGTYAQHRPLHYRNTLGSYSIVRGASPWC